MQLDEDSALALYRASRAADPTYFTAQFEYALQMLYWFRGPELRREIMKGDTSSALGACLLAASRMGPDDARPMKRMLEIEARFGPSQCTDAFLVTTQAFSAVRASRAMRDSWHLAEVISAITHKKWNSAGDWRSADEMLMSGIRTVENPVAKFELMRVRAGWRMARGDTTGSRTLWSEIAREIRRDGRPGPMAALYSAACADHYTTLGRTVEARDEFCRHFLMIARSRRAKLTEVTALRWMGKGRLERGDLVGAAPLLNRSVQLADVLGVPGLQLDAYTLRGRYLTKAGKLDLAVRDLNRAITAGRAAELPYFLAEAFHNLAHAHQGAGRIAEAVAMADSFATIAGTLSGSSLRWSSRHDAGTIRWAAGWHAAAARDFEAMVRVVDELGNDGHSFAGEYYERIGNLSKAMHYYGIGARLPNPDLRNLAALARVYEAIGMPDSAESIARLHDAGSHRWPITGQPLLPSVLARRGRMGEAVALADVWARRQLAGGNVEGAAVAHLRLAELLLRSGQTRDALTAAARADSLVALLRLAAHQVAARTIVGRALVAGGRRDEGLAALREAVRLAAGRPTTESTLESNQALGDELATLGRRDEALAAYGAAAVAVERMTAGLTEDSHRAGFKARHLAPFDGAIRAVLDGARTKANAEAMLQWSIRRKAAALRLAGQPIGAARPLVRTAELRARLQPDEALIDFTMLDSAVAAVVVRNSSIAVVRLTAQASEIKNWIETLRRPFVATPGGNIDLAHATFDASIAERLYHELLRPLEPALAGARQLTLVPDGSLWYAPFPALITSHRSDTASSHPRYLLERFELRMLPSADVVGQSLTVLKRGFRVAAFGYNVPGAANELSAIRVILGNRVTLREGPDATESAALAASAEVVHLAVHGIMNDRDPLASHLRLAPKAGDDGLLHLSEVASRRLSPRLVVLTACEAVSGKLYAGEGLMGIARAFLLAGADQVVASQWPVDASAVELSSVFYRELARGRSPSAALRSAQLALLVSPRTAHPLHWAGFVAFASGR